MNGFEKDLEKIHQFVFANKIDEIFYHSYFDKIELLNFPNNPIKKISYLRISKVDRLLWEVQNLNNLPPELESLNLEESPLKFSKLSNLPIGLKSLAIPIEYNFELDTLPLGLEILTIRIHHDTQYNLCYLPESLRELCVIGLGTKMDFSNLPVGLEKFEMDTPRIENSTEYTQNNFQTLLSNLPRGLKTLYLPYVDFNLQIHNIPPKLQELRIPINFNKNFISNILKLDTLEPIRIKKLFIGRTNSYNYTGSGYEPIFLFDCNFCAIPDFIEEIVFGNDFNEPPTYLPPNLKKITFGNTFNKKIAKSIIPNSVEEMGFGNQYNYPLPEYPSSLKILRLGRNFTRNLTNLPVGLKELELGEKFYGKLILPEGLEVLKFDMRGEFFQDLILPDTIKIIELGNGYKGKLINLPKSLESIKYNSHGKNHINSLLVSNNYQGEIINW